MIRPSFKPNKNHNLFNGARMIGLKIENVRKRKLKTPNEVARKTPSITKKYIEAPKNTAEKK